jgi:MerR family transcriptional regulator, activator of bmr gene
MKENLFLIGEASEICGMTAKALRFYEKAGLVAPEHVDPGTKYRYYSAAQLVRLEIVRAARSMGLGIGEIRALLGAGDRATLARLIEAQENRALSRIEELEKSLAAFKAIRSALADPRPDAVERGVLVRDIPERTILSRAIGLSPGAQEVARAAASLERDAKRLGLANLFETGILLRKGDDGGLRPAAAYLVVAVPAISGGEGLTVIPSGKYLCVRYAERTAESRQRGLWEYLRGKGLKPELALQADLIGASFGFGEDAAELQILSARVRGGRAKGPRK